ncbi:MAG: autotransporter domain-containing protein [Pseudomonadota bacterium]
MSGIGVRRVWVYFFAVALLSGLGKINPTYATDPDTDDNYNGAALSAIQNNSQDELLNAVIPVSQFGPIGVPLPDLRLVKLNVEIKQLNKKKEDLLRVASATAPIHFQGNTLEVFRGFLAFVANRDPRDTGEPFVDVFLDLSEKLFTNPKTGIVESSPDAFRRIFGSNRAMEEFVKRLSKIADELVDKKIEIAIIKGEPLGISVGGRDPFSLPQPDYSATISRDMIVEATSGGAPAAHAIAPGWLAFASISASKFKKDDQVDTDGLQTGFTGGFTRVINEHLALGAFLRYRHVNADSLIFVSKFDMDFLGGGLLLQSELPGGILFEAAGSYERGWVDAALGVDTASYTMDVFSANARLSKEFVPAPDWTVTPVLGFAYSSYHINRFTDSGGTVAGNTTSEHARITVGPKVGRDIPLPRAGIENIAVQGAVYGLFDVVNEADRIVGINRASEPKYGVNLTGSMDVEYENGAKAGISVAGTIMDRGYRSYSAAFNFSAPLDTAASGTHGFLAGGDDAPVPRWIGSYAGLSAGYGVSEMQLTNLISGATSGEFDMEGFAGGLVWGFNAPLGLSGAVWGLESESLLTDIDGGSRPAICGQPGCNADHELISMKKLRLGLPLGNVMPYIAGGVAATLTDANFNFNNNADSKLHWGFVVGGGIECACGNGWKARIDYSYVDVAKRRHNLDGIPYRVDPDGMHLIRAMLTFDIDLAALLR